MTRGDVLFIFRDGAQYRCHVGADGYPAAMVPFLRKILDGLREGDAEMTRKIYLPGPFFAGESSGKDFNYYYVVDARSEQIEVSEDTLEGGEPVTWTAEMIERELAEHADCATLISFPKEGSGGRRRRGQKRAAAA